MNKDIKTACTDNINLIFGTKLRDIIYISIGDPKILPNETRHDFIRRRARDKFKSQEVEYAKSELFNKMSRMIVNVGIYLEEAMRNERRKGLEN